jgi:hypothetical protein
MNMGQVGPDENKDSYKRHGGTLPREWRSTALCGWFIDLVSHIRSMMC